MKILMINKFLHSNGGSETYVFKLGKHLQTLGHEVQYFGMEHAGRCVGNRVNAYTADMDFHGGSKLAKLTYPIKTIYSSEARRKLRLVLADFQPDVCHLNNFNYQLVCPNHMCSNPNTGRNCEKCLGGHFINCAKGRCIHGSLAKSAVGTLEALLWNGCGVYQNIDTIICCSEFLKTKMDCNPLFARKTVALHNFVDRVEPMETEKQDYVLYFGRFSREKGIDTLLKAARALPEIPFIFAGTGPLEGELAGVPNIQNVGFQRGQALETLIRQARFSVYPSQWYENCPFSVMESQLYGTPVLGADIGGIPELIAEGKTGELFESGNPGQLKEKIEKMWENRELTEQYTENCANLRFDDVHAYTEKLLKLYRGETLC